MRACSIIFAPQGLKIGYSEASARIIRARVPVGDDSCLPEALGGNEANATLDLPLVPLTWIRIASFHPETLTH
jgi:hypothetical protein